MIKTFWIVLAIFCGAFHGYICAILIWLQDHAVGMLLKIPDKCSPSKLSSSICNNQSSIANLLEKKWIQESISIWQ